MPYLSSNHYQDALSCCVILALIKFLLFMVILMFKNLSKSKLGLSVIFSISFITMTLQNANAGVMVVNGDFELPGTNITSGFAQGITNWGEANVGVNAFTDFLITYNPILPHS